MLLKLVFSGADSLHFPRYSIYNVSCVPWASSIPMIPSTCIPVDRRSCSRPDGRRTELRSDSGGPHIHYNLYRRLAPPSLEYTHTWNTHTHTHTYIYIYIYNLTHGEELAGVNTNLSKMYLCMCVFVFLISSGTSNFAEPGSDRVYVHVCLCLCMCVTWGR